MPREAKLSDGALLILACAAKGWAHRSTTMHDDVWHLSPQRGSGHKAIGRAPAGQKLVRDGLLTGGPFPAPTKAGRDALDAARKAGRRLDYGIGRKPRVVQDDPQAGETVAEPQPAEDSSMRVGPQLTDAEKRKRLHIQTNGPMTYVCVYGKVIGTVAEVANTPGVTPKKVFEANSRERGVYADRRDTLNEAVTAVLRR